MIEGKKYLDKFINKKENGLANGIIPTESNKIKKYNNSMMKKY